MKLTSVEIYPDDSSSFISLSFRDPKSLNPFIVKSILGLDADEIIPRYYGANGSTKFYNLSLENRDIIIKAGMNPNFASNQSYSDLRDIIYKIIASSRTGKLELRFNNGITTVAGVHGFISKIETAHFEKTQEVQITIKCDEPMLKALTPVLVNISGLNPFDTSISDLASTAPHGFAFDMNILNATPAIKITDPGDLTWAFEIVPLGGFLTGDILHFSSEYNNKTLYAQRGGQVIHLADVISLGSIWPILFPGINRLSFTYPTRISWRSISYYPTYWGV